VQPSGVRQSETRAAVAEIKPSSLMVFLLSGGTKRQSASVPRSEPPLLRWHGATSRYLRCWGLLTNWLFGLPQISWQVEWSNQSLPLPGLKPPLAPLLWKSLMMIAEPFVGVLTLLLTHARDVPADGLCMSDPDSVKLWLSLDC
jgi:hypothetical protein